MIDVSNITTTTHTAPTKPGAIEFKVDGVAFVVFAQKRLPQNDAPLPVIEYNAGNTRYVARMTPDVDARCWLVEALVRGDIRAQKAWAAGHLAQTGTVAEGRTVIFGWSDRYRGPAIELVYRGRDLP